jgi:uncharacterized membrane protein YqiK
MELSPVIISVIIGSGIALAWFFIMTMYATSRKFRIMIRKTKCRMNFHVSSGKFEPAIGGRNVMRCLYCDCVMQEVAVTKDNVRRI